MHEVVACLPPLMAEEFYWSWTQKMKHPAQKLFDTIENLQHNGDAQTASRIVSTEAYFRLLNFLHWECFCILYSLILNVIMMDFKPVIDQKTFFDPRSSFADSSRLSEIENISAKCFEWLEKYDTEALPPSLRAAPSLVSAIHILIEHHDQTRVMAIIDKVIEIQEANPAAFSIRQRTAAYQVRSSSQLALSLRNEAQNTVKTSLSLFGVSEFNQAIDFPVPKEPLVADCFGNVLHVTSHMLWILGNDAVADSLALKAFSVKANAAGRDHISTLRTLCRLVESRLCVYVAFSQCGIIW